jgi:hypothetical protein
VEDGIVEVVVVVDLEEVLLLVEVLDLEQVVKEIMLVVQMVLLVEEVEEKAKLEIQTDKDMVEMVLHGMME